MSEYVVDRFKQFAKENRLRLSRLGLEPIIGGKYGWLCDTLPRESEYFAVQGQVRHCLIFQGNSARTLLSRARQAEAAGMQLKTKNGDYETSCYFNPVDSGQVEAAIRLVGARRKRMRILTDEQREALRTRLAKARLARTGQRAA